MPTIILIPDKIELTDDQFVRLPVLASMVSVIATDETDSVNVTVPDSMSASDILEYSRYEDAATDFALSGIPARAKIERLTLDWCGVDVSTLKTPRELREELQLEKLRTEQQKREMTTINARYVVLKTNYTNRLTHFPNLLTRFSEETDGEAVIICISDEPCWKTFEIVPEVAVSMKTMIETRDLGGCVVLRIDDTSKLTPFTALKSFNRLTDSGSGEFSYCSCFYGIPNTVITFVDDALGEVVVMVFDTESG